MLATVANLAIVVAMCMAVMVGAISTEAPEASPAMADTIAEEEYMAGVARMRDRSYVHPILNFCIRHWPVVTPTSVPSPASPSNVSAPWPTPQQQNLAMKLQPKSPTEVLANRFPHANGITWVF